MTVNSKKETPENFVGFKKGCVLLYYSSSERIRYLRVKGWCHEILSTFNFHHWVNKLRFLIERHSKLKAKLKMRVLFCLLERGRSCRDVPYRPCHLGVSFLRGGDVCGEKEYVYVWMGHSVDPPKGHSGQIAHTYAICTNSTALT